MLPDTRRRWENGLGRTLVPQVHAARSRIRAAHARLRAISARRHRGSTASARHPPGCSSLTHPPRPLLAPRWRAATGVLGLRAAAALAVGARCAECAAGARYPGINDDARLLTIGPDARRTTNGERRSATPKTRFGSGFERRPRPTQSSQGKMG